MTLKQKIRGVTSQLVWLQESLLGDNTHGSVIWWVGGHFATNEVSLHILFFTHMLGRHLILKTKGGPTTPTTLDRKNLRKGSMRFPAGIVWELRKGSSRSLEVLEVPVKRELARHHAVF